MLDPIVSLSAALTLSVIFASAASHKLKHPAWFRRQIREYELVHKGLVAVAGMALPVVELVIALGLLWRVSRPYAAVFGLVLIALYVLAIGINLLKGRKDIDCGCSGPAMRQPLQPGLLLRNLCLAVFAVGALLPSIERTLPVFDLFVAIAAASVSVLLYIAADFWLANRPALLKLLGEK
jgi:hypothetical protein